MLPPGHFTLAGASSIDLSRENYAVGRFAEFLPRFPGVG